MKKTVSLLLVCGLIITMLSGVFSAGALFADKNVTDNLLSKAYYLQSMDDGTVFFEKNADKKMPAAAFVKLVAAVVAIEKWGNLDEKVTVTNKSLSLVKYDYGVRTASYKDGEKVSKKELVNCLVVYSANDAASIIAYEISGSVEAFVKEMQSLAEKTGCTSTQFRNIHGFDEDGQYTTARDVAKFMQYALSYPAFSEAISADSVTLKATSQNEERTFKTGNKMKTASIADYYHQSVTGGKYTATEKAGECAAIVTNMDGYSYLAVTLGGKLSDIDSDGVKENSCFTDIKRMLNWVYDNIRYRVIASPEQSIAAVSVKAGKDTDKVRLVPEKEISALVPSNVTPASVMFEIVEDSVKKSITAPVEAGEALGQAKDYYAGIELCTINLVAAQTVERSFTGLIMATLSDIVGSTAFLVLTVLSFLAAAAYLVMIMSKFYGWDKKLENMAAIKKAQPKKKAPAKSSTAKKQPPKNIKK